MGQSPGISDDATIAVFCGDRGNGPGIFASIQTNVNEPLSSRLTIRLAGENNSTNGPNAELGTNSFGSPFYFASFDEPWRESVTKKEYDPHWGIETTSRTLKPGFDVEPAPAGH